MAKTGPEIKRVESQEERDQRRLYPEPYNEGSLEEVGRLAMVIRRAKDPNFDKPYQEEQKPPKKQIVGSPSERRQKRESQKQFDEAMERIGRAAMERLNNGLTHHDYGQLSKNFR